MKKPQQDKPNKPLEKLPEGVSTLTLSARLLREYGAGERWRVAGGLTVLAASSAVHLLQPWPMKLIIDVLTGTRQPPPMLASAAALLGGGSAVIVGVLCLAILVVHIVAGVLSVTSTYLLVSAGLR